MQPTVVYPCMLLGQPEVPDETGKMKFRYQIRFTTRIHHRFHIQPEINEGIMTDFLHRQVISPPIVSGTTAIDYYIYAKPYVKQL